MKILLINPAFNIPKAKYESSLSVGLLCLASYLNEYPVRKSFSNEVKIIDAARQNNWREILNQELPKSSLVGLSVMTTQIPSALEISQLIKENYPHIKVIWGGIHPTLFPEQCVENNWVDFAVMGEGEETLYELLYTFSEGNEENLKNIKGIAFKEKSGNIVVTEKRPLLAMNKIPLPEWGLMPQEVLDSLEIVPTHTSRGCPYRCTFCINAITQNLWRSRLPEEVLKDLKIIKRKFFGLDSFGRKNRKLRFWDENFFVDLDRAQKIISGMIEYDLIMPWETTMRVDCCVSLDDSILSLLRKSGCYLLSFGAESGSLKILEKINKGILPEQIIESARKCLRHNIIPQYSFMVGLPGESNKDVKQTIELIDKLLRLDKRVQILGPQAFRPYPGSKLYEECLEAGSPRSLGEAGSPRSLGEAGWQAPKNLEEWSKAIKNELNYLSVYNFPWVKKPDLVDSLEAYVRFGAHSLKSALSSTVKTNLFLKFLFVLLCKLRWKIRFFSFPWEIKLAKKFIRETSH